MANRRSPNFAEGFAQGFTPTFQSSIATSQQQAKEAALIQLRELLAQPEKQASIDLNKAHTNYYNAQTAKATNPTTDAYTLDQAAYIANPSSNPDEIARTKAALGHLYPNGYIPKDVAHQIATTGRSAFNKPEQYIDPSTGQVINVGPRQRILPPAPVAIDPNTGQQVQLPRGAKIVQAPGAKEAQDTIAKLGSFETTFGKYMKILETVPSGRVMGGGADLLNKYTGAYPQLKSARALQGIMTPMAARVLGGDVGNLNENEQTRAAQAVQLIDGTLEERKRGAQIMVDLLKAKREEAQKRVTPGMFRNAQSAPAARPSSQPEENNDPLGIR